MTVVVSEEVLRETSKCPHEFSCLDDGQCGDHPLCEVEDANGKNVLFLTTKRPAVCPYRLHFGYSQICRCPTHFALHEQRRM